MPHLPFARKYRPQAFEDLIGQPHVTGTLTRALKGQRLAQAYLFAGQRGVGKTSSARILAKSLNCERGTSPTPCQTCASCTQITEGRSLDVIEIDGASNRGIDEIRSLRESVPFAPTSGPFRVYIIDEVHMLTPEAFNALLKTLEEPPAHVKFIFATTMAAKIPPTILSRCQRFDFRRLDSSTIVQTLAKVVKAEKLEVDEPALFAIARASEGSLRDAEVTLEQLVSFVEGRIGESDVTELLGGVEADELFAWAQAILDRDAAQALGQIMKELERGKDPAQLLTSLLQHVRNLLVIRSARQDTSAELLTRLIDEPSDRITRLSRQAGQSTPQELLLMLQILTWAYELIRRSPMSQIILELAVVKLATREQWESLEQISRRLEQLSAEGTGPSASSAGPPASAGAVPRPVSASVPKPAEQPAAPAPAPKSAAQASAPRPPEIPSAALEPFAAVWPTFLERLGAKKISLAAYLADSKPVGKDGGTLTIGLQGFSLHQEVLTDADNHRLIESVLGEVCGAKVKVRYETLPEPEEDAGEPESPAAADPEEDVPGVVGDIVKLFNATVVDRSRPA